MPQPHPIVPQHAGTVRPRNGAHAGHAETTHAPPDDPDDELPPELLDELLPVSSASSASSPASGSSPPASSPGGGVMPLLLLLPPLLLLPLLLLPPFDELLDTVVVEPSGPTSSSSPSPSPAAAQAPNIPKPTINKPLTPARPYEYILPVYMLNLAGQRPTGPKAGSGDAHGTREGA